MRVISWNLNGLHSCVRNQSFAPILAREPDVVCCQEIRTQQQMLVLPGYHHYWNPGQRNGYSGTLLLSKAEPLTIRPGLGIPSLDSEGRVLAAEFEDFWLVNVYAPNSQKNLQRQHYRLEWDEAFLDFLTDLRADKPVVACGDLNVALLDIDVFPENLHQYWAQQGYDSDERAGLKAVIGSGFVDAFRMLYPDKERCYTWWSNRLNKRMENRGWRLDYFLVAEELAYAVEDVIHLTDITGSDHCPIELEMRL